MKIISEPTPLSAPFRFGNRSIGAAVAPLVIAEMSGNHNQSLERALALVDAATEAGAHALKIQTYTADTLTLDVRDGDFLIDDPKSPWAGRSLHELYEEAYTPWEWHAPIFARCKERGMLCFSSPFDESAIDFLEQFDPPGYKIASFEITDLRLIGAAAAKGRPLILSTGMASVAEIEEALAAARAAGARDIVLLKCTSTYPASPLNSNIETIPDMRQRFGTEIGISDHTAGVGVAVAAVALGAAVIEKHFTLNRADGGVDSAFSLEPHELKALVLESQRAWEARGKVSYGALADEQPSLRFRRSLYIAQDVRAGEKLTAQNVRIVRPGYGLAPKHFEEILGRRVIADAKKGTALRWEMLA